MNIYFTPCSTSFTAQPKIPRTQLEECLIKGLSNREIAKLFSVNEHTIGKYLKFYGLTPAIKQKVTEMHDITSKLMNNGAKMRNISDITGVGIKTIINWRKQNSIPNSLEVRRQKILDLYNRGVLIKHICKQLNTGTAVVKRVLLKAGYSAEEIKMQKLKKRFSMIMGDINEGMTVKEVAQKRNVSIDYVYDTIKKYRHHKNIMSSEGQSCSLA